MTNLHVLRPVNAELERRRKLARLGWGIMALAGLTLYVWFVVSGVARAIDLGY